jgi:hypothetical protein
VTKAQEALLDEIKGKGAVPVRGSKLRVAENLCKQGHVVMGTNGTPWSKGWSVTAEHMDDYMNRLEDQVIADEAGAAAAAIGSPQEGVR